MKYIGKKTGVLQLPNQLRNDPELGTAVRFIAAANRRSIQMQILDWIIEGVEKEQNFLRQKKSDAQFAVGPKSANVRQRQEKSA